MSYTADSDTPTLRFAFNGRRFARLAEQYCRRHGLACHTSVAYRSLLPKRTLTVFEVSGSAPALDEFVAWGCNHYSNADGFVSSLQTDQFGETDEV